ncbi:MAG: MBL fold metallo-hydrolase [Promethearchaeota archaeon]
MILKRLIVGPLGTNSYIFGSSITKEVVLIDVGGEPETIINVIEEMNVKPIGLLLTHGHYDHTLKLGKILRHFEMPLMYCKKEYDSGIYTQKKADKWLTEGDSIQIGEITLNVLETPGHSPGALSYYSKEPKEYEGQKIEGVIFTGDLIFRRSIGRSDLRGGDSNLLFSSIKTKIMYHSEITDNFIICPGHMGITSVGEERKSNMFKNYFLEDSDI